MCLAVDLSRKTLQIWSHFYRHGVIFFCILMRVAPHLCTNVLLYTYIMLWSTKVLRLKVPPSE